MGDIAVQRACRQFSRDSFLRLDECDDREFYAEDRFVSHLDSLARSTIEQLIGQLVVEEAPVILDLMSSWDSDLPDTLRPAKTIGLGLNENELRANRALNDRVIQDLNKNPRLPFGDGVFDAALCTVSVEYMTRPLEVFRDVGRVLKPGGLFLVVFSNRMFPTKAVKIWRESGEEERVMLVSDFFTVAGAFGKQRVFVSRGKPRPKDDKYAHLEIPSDPVYAVYASKIGKDHSVRPAPKVAPRAPKYDAEQVAQRKRTIRDTLCCPYCGTRLKKWLVPDTPFTEWPNEFMYICFNNECGYFVGGWDAMAAQGNPCSYRLMYDPLRDACHPVPVLSREALRDGIVE